MIKHIKKIFFFFLNVVLLRLKITYLCKKNIFKNVIDFEVMSVQRLKNHPVYYIHKNKLFLIISVI